MKNWKDARKINLETMEQYDRLLDEGYEIESIEWKFENVEEGMKGYLFLQKGEHRLLAECTAIADHTLQLLSLYNFEKKKPVFTWVPSTNPYFDIQKTLASYFTEEHVKPLAINRLKTSDDKRIYEIMRDWLRKRKNILYPLAGVSELFYHILIVNEKGGTFDSKTYAKEVMTLREVRSLIESAKQYDTSTALSFFVLSRKANALDSNSDLLVGIIIYDLKNRQTVCFNIKSALSYFNRHKQVKGGGMFESLMDVFHESVNDSLEFKSFPPLPLDSPWYTALPWLVFVALYPVSLDDDVQEAVPERKISIPEFFVFGYSSYLQEGNSFHFRPFSSTEGGSATCILNFDNSNRLPYNLRFDQSAAERLVHMDFGYYPAKNSQIKFVRHRPLDMELILNTNQDLFVAALAAGLYDGYFTTIIKNGIKGLKEVTKRNPVYLYPLVFVWQLDTAIIWLNQNPPGYIVLEKLFRKQDLNDTEKELLQRMFTEEVGIVTENRECMPGINFLGYMAMTRYKRGQTHIQMNP